MSQEPSAGPLGRLRAMVARHPLAARLLLWASVATTLAGALLALGGETLLGDPAVAQGGGALSLGAGAIYAGLRLLGARAAGPHDGAARPAEHRRGTRRR